MWFIYFFNIFYILLYENKIYLMHKKLIGVTSYLSVGDNGFQAAIGNKLNFFYVILVIIFYFKLSIKIYVISHEGLGISV